MKDFVHAMKDLIPEVASGAILVWFFLNFKTFTPVEFSSAQPWAFAAAAALGIRQVQTAMKGGNGNGEAPQQPQA